MIKIPRVKTSKVGISEETLKNEFFGSSYPKDKIDYKDASNRKNLFKKDIFEGSSGKDFYSLEPLLKPEKVESSLVKTEEVVTPINNDEALFVPPNERNIFSGDDGYKLLSDKMTGTVGKQSGLTIDQMMKKNYTGNLPTKGPKTPYPYKKTEFIGPKEEKILVARGHVAQTDVRPEPVNPGSIDQDTYDIIKQVSDEDGFIDFKKSNEGLTGAQSKISSLRDVDDYVNNGKKRFRSSHSKGSLKIHGDFIVPPEYRYMVDFNEIFPNYTQGGKKTKFSKHHQGFLTNFTRNNSYHKHYEGLLYRWLTEQKLIKKAFKDDKIPEAQYNKDLEEAKGYIKYIREDMEKLGLETKVWNKNKKGFDTYGERYGDKQLSELYKNQKKTYDLNIPPKTAGDLTQNKFEHMKTDFYDILKQKEKDGITGGTGVKPEGHNKGGFARRMMAIGGDMSQFNETEEVISTPNGMEGEFDVAMSFKNPFKFKKPPPLFDESTSKIKISGAVDNVDDIKATETITDTNNGIFTLKSETEIINAPQEIMTGGQWLGFLKKKGVSPTELDEFGLGNYLTGYQNAKVKKADLMEAYSNLKPNITYSINQKEPFQKGLDDFGSFLTKRDGGGGYYHGTSSAGVEEIRGLNNKPQDIAGDSARVQLAELFKSSSDNGQVMDQGAGVINKVFKQFYGIDNVLKDGIPEGSKIPFYSKTIVERFKRLQSGEGFYMSKTQPRHEGAQFLSGGTGYMEIPITYNPNPKGPRANEPKFTEGGGHFSNPTGNNPVFWMRASERTDEAGRRVLFIEEIQSDLHQGVQQKGKKYATRQDAAGNVNITDLNSQRQKLADELNKLTDSIDKVAGHTDPSAQTILGRLKVKRDGIRKQLVAVAQKLDKIDATADGVPEAPFKKSENQAKMAIKIAINLARENGYDGVVMTSGKAKNAGASATGSVAKGNLGFYNNIATKAMKNAAKNNQLDFSSTNIKDGKGNTWAKLPYIDLKGTRNKPTDLYKKDGGFIDYSSFVDVVPTL